MDGLRIYDRFSVAQQLYMSPLSLGRVIKYPILAIDRWGTNRTEGGKVKKNRKDVQKTQLFIHSIYIIGMEPTGRPSQ